MDKAFDYNALESLQEYLGNPDPSGLEQVLGNAFVEFDESEAVKVFETMTRYGENEAMYKAEYRKYFLKSGFYGSINSQALGTSRTSCTGHGEDDNGDPAAVLRTPRSLQSRASNASLSPLWQESRTVFVMRVSTLWHQSDALCPFHRQVVFYRLLFPVSRHWLVWRCCSGGDGRVFGSWPGYTV